MMTPRERERGIQRSRNYEVIVTISSTSHE
jgi:hypothetical protein